MKTSSCSLKLITFALHQAENGVPATEVCREMDISERNLSMEEIVRRDERRRGAAAQGAGSVGLSQRRGA